MRSLRGERNAELVATTCEAAHQTRQTRAKKIVSVAASLHLVLTHNKSVAMFAVEKAIEHLWAFVLVNDLKWDFYHERWVPRPTFECDVVVIPFPSGRDGQLVEYFIREHLHTLSRALATLVLHVDPQKLPLNVRLPRHCHVVIERYAHIDGPKLVSMHHGRQSPRFPECLSCSIHSCNGPQASGYCDLLLKLLAHVMSNEGMPMESLELVPSA